MISLIICSRNSEISPLLKKNITETIGVGYEVIIIDNSQNKYSIFQAYNEGVRKSIFPYLCFMHEDILFHTKDWGCKVIEHFKNPQVGLIGVVGGHYMPQCPASWWSTQYNSGQFIQGFYDKHKYNTETISCSRYKKPNETSLNVAAVDGFWFCIPRKLFSVVKFDEETFKEFHFYDTDICFQIINQNKEVRVVFDILIEHSSRGTQNGAFLEQRVICYNKWAHFLPIIRGIEISTYDIEDRLKLAEEINAITLYRYKEIEQIKSSCAYRLGKTILKPISFFRQKIK
jgi:hypothetical protein